MTKYLFGCLCSLLLVLSSGLHAQGSVEDRPPVTMTFFLNNAFIVQSPGKVIDLGGLLIRDGLIQAVGKDLKAPADAKVMEADSMYIYAGFIDGLSNLGVPKPKQESGGNTRGGGRIYNPSYEQAGIHTANNVAGLLAPTEKDIADMRAIGFTAAHVVPREGMLPGQGAVILLGGDDAAKMIVRERSSLFAQFEGADGGAYPSTDMAIMSKFRELYQQARQHQSHQANYAKNPRGMSRPAQNDVLAAFGPSIEGERPIFFAVDGIKEMHRAITLSKELGFPLALADVTMAQKAIAPLKASGASLFLTMDLPEAKKAEKKDEEETDPEKKKLEESRAAAMQLHEEQAAMLAKEGIAFGFSTLSAKSKDVRENLARMIKAGLTADQALAALTTEPARMLGVSNIMGTVEKGKIANLIVTDQPYFEEGANVRYVFVDGMPSEYEVKKKKKKSAGDPAAKVMAAGTWALEIDVPMEQMSTPTLTITDDNGSLTGKIVSGMGANDISDMSLEGNNLTFSYSVDGGGQTVTVTFDLTIDGDTLEGTMSAGNFGSFDVEGDRESGPKRQ